MIDKNCIVGYRRYGPEINKHSQLRRYHPNSRPFKLGLIHQSGLVAWLFSRQPFNPTTFSQS